MAKTLLKTNPMGDTLSRLRAFDADFVNNCTETTWLIGVDEVGRGSAIGPVTACAVAFPDDCSENSWQQLAPLNDSKKLRPKIRQALQGVLQQHAYWALGEATREEVDTLNVYQASRLAASKAVCNLWQQLSTISNRPALLLVDGNARLPEEWLPQPSKGLTQHTVIQGDGHSAVIAAASVIAKETRDDWVKAMALQYPVYGWHTNMGYLTAAHRQAIAAHGATPLHRTSFTLTAQSAD